MKNLQVRNMHDDVFFKMLELKAKFRCRTWEQFFEKLFSAQIADKLLKGNFKEEAAQVGIAWARSIDAKLDAVDREIVAKGEDALV